MNTLTVYNFGPITSASVTFSDLTVFVGPQATGKSIFLQLHKLLLDIVPIRNRFKRFNVDWAGKTSHFLELYFGEGMANLYQPEKTQILSNNIAVQLERVISENSRHRQEKEKMFYIPAQRVMSLRDGSTRPFTEYRSGDPFVLREFSETVHNLLQSEFAVSSQLFPPEHRLKKQLRTMLLEHVFGSFGLQIDTEHSVKRIVLSSREGEVKLPYSVWSAGQREFVPLLLGLYWLLPPNRMRRNALEWVVIEEPEMGLHPRAISALLALVLDLLARGYKICISTHSPHILDIVWALQIMQKHQGTAQDVLDMLHLSVDQETRKLASSALAKGSKVYFFKRDGNVIDISGLDPGSEDGDESGWGGLTEFSANVGDVVARVVNRSTREIV
ncbi:AAA family ATPase [Chloroflexus aurantiacus]